VAGMQMDGPTQSQPTLTSHKGQAPVCGWMEGWMDGWMVGWMEGWTDEVQGPSE